MKPFTPLALLAALLASATVAGQAPSQFVRLFNGKNLDGWVNVYTNPDTWKVRNGILICSGHPIGVMRTVKEYENFVLHIDSVRAWRSDNSRPPTTGSIRMSADGEGLGD